IEVLRGTLDLLILKAVSWGSTHGYAVARWIEQATDDVLRIEEGSLYPALHRLETRGWIDASWGLSEKNRRAKFYTLTPAGRAQAGRRGPRRRRRGAGGVRRVRQGARAAGAPRERARRPAHRPPLRGAIARARPGLDGRRAPDHRVRRRRDDDGVQRRRRAA